MFAVMQVGAFGIFVVVDICMLCQTIVVWISRTHRAGVAAATGGISEN